MKTIRNQETTPDIGGEIKTPVPSHRRLLSRRALLQNGILLLGAAGLSQGEISQLWAEENAPVKPAVRMGLITDIHYADKPEGRTRYYRESLPKMTEAINRFNEDKVDCVVQLGDLIDAGETPDEEMNFLDTIEAEYARFNGPRHYVLGNHDAWSLTKRQFLDKCGAKEEFYSFDQGKFHFVILDACYRSDGVPYGEKNFKWNDSDIPAAQHTWLEADLKRADKPTIIFVHQRLDVKPNYTAKSAPAVRTILEKSKNVLAVFQGHSHKNDYQEINGVHYCTLRAIIEGSGEANNGYSELSVWPNGTIKVTGFREQKHYDWKA